MRSPQSTTCSASDFESSGSSSEQELQQQSQSLKLEKAATFICTKWSFKSLVTNFKDKNELSSDI